MASGVRRTEIRLLSWNDCGPAVRLAQVAVREAHPWVSGHTWGLSLRECPLLINQQQCLGWSSQQLHPYRIRCFYFSYGRDLFDTWAGSFMRLWGWFGVRNLKCLVLVFWGQGFPCACLSPAALPWISYFAIQFSSVLRKNPLRSRPGSVLHVLQDGAAVLCDMSCCPPEWQEPDEMLMLHCPIGTTPVSSKTAAALHSPNETVGKNNASAHFNWTGEEVIL